jgi:hypothetical protein
MTDRLTDLKWHVVRANRPDSVGGTDYGILDERNLVVASVHEVVAPGIRYNAQRHARLMAAAPVMLAALEAYDAWEWHLTEPDTHGTEYTDCQKTDLRLYARWLSERAALAVAGEPLAAQSIYRRFLGPERTGVIDRMIDDYRLHLMKVEQENKDAQKA